jgi:5-methylcytosine-specific restriction enzyme A
LITSHIKDVFQGKVALGCKRSSLWPQVRENHLKKNPTCALCGGTKQLEVHHIKSFSDYPELELDENNLITLCESKSFGVSCHIFVGHCGNYRKINPTVVEDAAYWLKKIKYT